MTLETDTQIEIDGLNFAEGPRWRGDALWCSDMFGHSVLRLRAGEDDSEVVAHMPFDNPSGIGWLPDGELLVVAMQTQAVYRSSGPDSMELHADLSGIARGMTNDMVVAEDGTSYVGDGGHPRFGQSGTRRTGQLLTVSPDGRLIGSVDDLQGPNGLVLTPDGANVIVAEQFGARLTAYDVASDGTLGARRTHATLRPPVDGTEARRPDGICLDSDGGVWVADLTYRQVIRVGTDGSITDTILFESMFPIACVLGGAERKRLFVCVSEHIDGTRLGSHPVSKVVSLEVARSGAGVP